LDSSNIKYMKILIITPRFPIPTSGACEQDRLEGMKQLQRLGHEVQVIGKVFDFQNEENIMNFSKEYNIPVHTIPYRYSKKRGFFENILYLLKRFIWLPYWDGAAYEYADPNIKQELEDILKSWKPDIVWFDYTFMLSLYPIARRYNCKIITHSLIYDPKNLLEEDGRSLKNRFSALIKTLTDYIAIRKSDYFFAIAHDEKRMYEKLGAKKIEVLPLRALYNFLGKNSDIRDREVLSVFFLGSSYNIKHNLQAVRMVIEQIAPSANKKYPGKFKFFVTGRKLPEELQKKCNGNIKYVGFIDDFEEFLSDMDVALIPSLFGTGMQQKIFEPISRGFPIITSKRGLGGYPFECGKEILCAYKAEEFVAGLGEVLDFDTRKELSRRAVEKSSKLFSREKSDNLVIQAINYVSQENKTNKESSWQGKNVFVTGHSGFIGSHLVKKLTSLGANIQRCEIDLLKEDLKGKNYMVPDYIFHLASRSPSATDAVDASKIIEDNANMTKNVLEFARETFAKVIFVSSSHVYPPITADIAHPWKESDIEYGKALSTFGLSKQKAEQLCVDYGKEYDLEILIVRLSNVYGPGDESNRFVPTFVRKCLDREFPLSVLGNKDAVRDFVYIDDVIDGLTKCNNVLGYTEVINMGSGLNTTMKQLAEAIKNEAGLENEDIKYQDTNDEKPAYNVLDIKKAKEMTSYAPSISLSDGVAKTVKWWQEQKRQGNFK